MKLIEQSFEIMRIDANPLITIEKAGRTCYKSEDKICEGSAERFTRGLLKSGHESVIEHASATVKFITNRGVTHELVRHRLCAFSQESTRYVNYGGDDMEFICPVWFDNNYFHNVDDYVPEFEFIKACRLAEHQYKQLLICGWKPEQAREVLPNALKTEIVVTANFREWRHIFRLRTSNKAHPQIRELMRKCLAEFQRQVPVIFGDILW